MTSFPVEAGAVEAIAERLNGWLGLPEAEREPLGEALVETARPALELGGRRPRRPRRLGGSGEPAEPSAGYWAIEPPPPLQ